MGQAQSDTPWSHQKTWVTGIGSHFHHLEMVSSMEIALKLKCVKEELELKRGPDDVAKSTVALLTSRFEVMARISPVVSVKSFSGVSQQLACMSESLWSAFGLSNLLYPHGVHLECKGPFSKHIQSTISTWSRLWMYRVPNQCISNSIYPYGAGLECRESTLDAYRKYNIRT